MSDIVQWIHVFTELLLTPSDPSRQNCDDATLHGSATGREANNLALARELQCELNNQGNSNNKLKEPYMPLINVKMLGGVFTTKQNRT